MRMKASKRSWKNVNPFGGTVKKMSFKVPSFLRLILATLLLVSVVPGQKSGSHSSRVRSSMTPEANALVDNAIGIVCTQAKLDPQSSVAIDVMQARPSLPIHSPEAKAGAERAQRLLPAAKSLAISSLNQLADEYRLNKSSRFRSRLRQATARVNSVKRVRPDMESRDNASVFLSKPHVITFGTLFLAGLRSDEGMISVLAHELMHIADGDNDSLRLLVAAVGNKASDLTGLEIHGQRSEEITCDLIGAMAARAYVASTPGYESITRRLARSVQHNCVEVDEGDEDHLSPRQTIRVLLALNPVLVRELINDHEERTPGRKL